MSAVRPDIVAKLWFLCNLLKDDGVTYHQYVTELTYLLFLKLAKETATESQLPESARWDQLVTTAAAERLGYYQRTLTQLGIQGSPLVREIFAGASSSIKKPATLVALVAAMDQLDWYSARQEGLGDLYEGLLEKNASEKKAGAGQYFTPRCLVDSLVKLMVPTLDDVIQDPAAGTGGFLIAASRYVRTHSDAASWNAAQRRKYHSGTFYGMEHVHDTHRLALMNLMLHGLDSDPAGIRYGDTLSPAGAALPRATLILTNPPFGTKKGGGLPTRTDFVFPTSNKQLCFLQHIYHSLQPGGRAAVVLPDNVLFEGNVGRQLRIELMHRCNLHTILRLPTGIFYAQGVKTNVLFFTRGKQDKDNTQEVWVYDLRTNMPQFGKRTTLTPQHFAPFEAAFGNDPLGNLPSLAQRQDTGPHGRFRKFTREWIREHDDSLDITWLKEETDHKRETLPAPAVLVREAIKELDGAFAELRGILAELGETSEGVA